MLICQFFGYTKRDRNRLKEKEEKGGQVYLFAIDERFFVL